MPTLLKGFVVGQGELYVSADGRKRTRPKLFEYEAGDNTMLLVRIGSESLWLDPESATAVRNALDALIEEMA